MTCNIVFLCTEYNTYPDVCIKAIEGLPQARSFNFYVFCWGESNSRRIKPILYKNSTSSIFSCTEDFTSVSLLKRVIQINPSMLVCSGWQERKYLLVCFVMKSFFGIPVVTAFDDQYSPILPNPVKPILRFIVSRLFFTDAWISGYSQYAFAASCGFRDRSITLGCLSGSQNNFFFQTPDLDARILTRKPYFLYIGNIRIVKGVDILVEAYANYRSLSKDPWDLLIIGNSVDLCIDPLTPGVNLLGYINNDFLSQYIKLAQVCILPSRLDQWGMALHEYAQLGKPIIASQGCGARHQFVVHGYNGFIFYDESPVSLATLMVRLASFSPDLLALMGERSLALSSSMSPEISAFSLLSILDKSQLTETPGSCA